MSSGAAAHPRRPGWLIIAGIMSKRLRGPVAAAVLLVLGACSTHHGRAALQPTPDGTALEQQVFAAVNEHRTARRLPPLAWNEVVAEQARKHSRRMASGATSLGHRDFRKRVAAIGEAVPWSRAAENVAVSQAAANAMNMWLHKRGHRRNIEGKFDLTGVGAARAANGSIFFTQIFVKSE